MEARICEFTMAVNAFLMRNQSGPLTDAFLDWLEPIAQNYHGLAAIPHLDLPGLIAQLRGASEKLTTVGDFQIGG